MAQIQVPNDWLAQVGQLLGVGGGGMLLLKLIERIFARDDREAADRAAVSSELRADIRTLKGDIDRLEERLEAERTAKDGLFGRVIEFQAENRALRSRYHELRNVMAIVAATNALYHRQLGLPESEAPKIPEWVYRPVEGPSAGLPIDGGPEPGPPEQH